MRVPVALAAGAQITQSNNTGNLTLINNSINSVSINSSGNVGVGSTNPGTTLDVFGTLRLDNNGTLYVGTPAFSDTGTLAQQPPTTGNKTQIGDTYQIIARSQETPQIVFNEEEFMKDESTKNLMQYLKSKCVKHTIKIAS